MQAVPMGLETPKERSANPAAIEADARDLENLKLLRELMASV